MKGFAFVLLIAVALQACSADVRPQDVIAQEWEAFKAQHNKEYSQSEDYFRMRVFMENKHKIAKHNVRYQQGHRKYMLRMNKYGDLLHHEFVGFMNGLNKNYNKTRTGATFLSPENYMLPTEVDWREKGYVTPVKDQGQCGSCWAFSTTGSLEGQHYRKTKKLVSLSEQNLVDCSSSFGNNGCNGGLMDQAFQYIHDNHGLDTENSYPYEAKDGKCRYKPRNKGATDKGFVDIEQGNEEKLQQASASVGPISIAIDASHESFQFYSKGVYDEPDCSSEELDHGVLLVGYGTEEDQDYWLVKNSWGPTWGDGGYVKMSRNKNNQCGVASQASYPLV